MHALNPHWYSAVTPTPTSPAPQTALAVGARVRARMARTLEAEEVIPNDFILILGLGLEFFLLR